MRLQILITISSLLSILPTIVQAFDEPANYIGCYGGSITGKTSSFQWQSSGNCQEACPGYDYIAIQSQKCVCLNDLPSNNNKLANDKCTTPCPGYGVTSCGTVDDDLYTVYQGANGNATNPVVVSSSSIDTSSITSSPTSSKTVITSSHTTDNSVVVKTITQDSNPTESSDSNNSKTNDNKDENKSTNIGPIVGGVVGGVAGAVIIAGLIFFWIRRNREDDDDDYDEEEFFDHKPINRNVGGSRRVKPSPLDMPMTNPFVDPANSSTTPRRNDTVHHGGGFVDPRVNPIMMGGRRRLSEGSFIDEATNFPRKPLQVANPDN